MSAAGRHDRDRLDAEQAEHEVVAVALRVVAAGHPLLDDEAALQPFLHRRREGDAAVVRLRRAAGDQRVGAFGERIGHQELELAGLVAAGEEAEQVVALDPDLGAAAAGALRRERGAEARQGLERRRPGGVAAAGEAGEVHGAGGGRKGSIVVRAGSAAGAAASPSRTPPASGCARRRRDRSAPPSRRRCPCRPRASRRSRPRPCGTRRPRSRPGGRRA